MGKGRRAAGSTVVGKGKAGIEVYSRQLQKEGRKAAMSRRHMPTLSVCHPPPSHMGRSFPACLFLPCCGKVCMVRIQLLKGRGSSCLPSLSVCPRIAYCPKNQWQNVLPSHKTNLSVLSQFCLFRPVSKTKRSFSLPKCLNQTTLKLTKHDQQKQNGMSSTSQQHVCP